jgi:short-subunit dehydrogenase
MTDLRDAHVLVVGATGGLGAAIARQLAAAGARVSLSGRRADALAALSAELGASVVRSVVADLTKPGSAQDIVDAVTAGQQGLTGVVYAAGVVAFGPALELDDDVLDELCSSTSSALYGWSARPRPRWPRVGSWLTSARSSPSSPRRAWRRTRPARPR